ncbi:YicC/YloC family endoribonuclease [Psittacicella hinzii]|uniref:YicC family protein n=1 Tax=Psittacicella hinzii TaxID=2028575 RepID=A0A3A1YRA9_9GAMM|nr:YicC/YloC family endoribonuclease [Psittacicella hinzii]RIY40803.1 YicC family protein [Psittacicella hinzii]
MLHSMTGFVSHECEIGDYHLIWEVKTLNHRFFDMALKMPDSLRCVEVELRNVAKNHLRRGKMDVTLYFKNRNLKSNLEVAPERLAEIASCFAQAQNIFVENGVDRQFLRINLNEIFSNSLFSGNDGRNIDDSFKEQVVASFEQAVIKLNQARRAEGTRLREVLECNLCSMKQITAEICQYSRQIKEQAQQKLIAKVKELAENVILDPIRLEQEVVLLAQKADIQEELDRLNSHYCALTQLLNSEEQVGRKIDFLMQELNRESNTICSKSTDINIINRAVNLKTYIEQMREQIQNIE